MTRTADIDLPYTFAQRTVAFSAQVNGDLAEIQTKFNLHLDRVPVTVDDYGAAGDGTTDDTAAIQAAVDAAGATGGDIRLTRGKTYLLGTAPIALPKNLTGWLRILGHGATIKLSASAPGAFLLGVGSSDYDTYRYLILEGILVDGNNVQSSSGFAQLIGNYSGSSYYRRLNFHDIAVRRCRTINVPTSTSLLSLNRAIAITGYHVAASETQTNTTDILVEDCDFSGGNVGVSVIGMGGGATSDVYEVYHDRIHIVRCRHDTLTTPASRGDANFHIGGAGFGGICSIRDCYGNRSGDVGVEIDGMMLATVSATKIDDAYNEHYLLKNFHAASDADAQITIIDGCQARNTLAAGPQFSGFVFTNNTAGPAYGHCILRGSAFRSAQTQFGQTFPPAYQASGNVKALTIEDFTIDVPALADTSSVASTTYRFLYINPSTSCAVSVKRLKIKVAGSTTNSSGTVRIAQIDSNGATTTLDIEDYRISWNVTGSSTVTLLSMNSGTVRGTVRRLLLTDYAGNSSPRGIRYDGTGSLTIDGRVVIMDCDFSHGPSGITEIFSGDTTNAGKVITRDIVWKNNPAVATLTPGGSPYTYQNLDLYRERILISAGETTKIEWSNDGSTYVDTGNPGGGMVYLDVGEYVKVTYNQAPTVKKAPIR